MAAAAMNPPSSSVRLPLVDALRGFAVAQMIVYHFIYDLNYFGWLQLGMTRNQPWVGWRTAIVTQFLLLVGVSLVLRLARRPGWRDFWWRWAQVAAAAALVSLGSWLMFGPRWIYFGILHFIAVALVVARLLAPLREWNLLPAAAALAAGWFYLDPAFNAAPANIVGFVTIKPRTEDYVPLFPWIAATLAGLALGSWWQRHGFALSPTWQRVNAHPPRLLVLLGTWALTVYLVHQPILIGLLWLIRKSA
jgi:uncharacterized membrane protein